MNIRTATLQDIDQIAAVEKECFPAAEAATKEEFEQRLSHYADHFWLMFEDDTLIAFVDGMVTDQEDLTDEMYENASMHQENGAWQMQKTREEKVLSLRAKTGWCITMQNLVLKMKAFQNLCTEMSCGIR